MKGEEKARRRGCKDQLHNAAAAAAAAAASTAVAITAITAPFLRFWVIATGSRNCDSRDDGRRVDRTAKLQAPPKCTSAPHPTQCHAGGRRVARAQRTITTTTTTTTTSTAFSRGTVSFVLVSTDEDAAQAAVVGPEERRPVVATPAVQPATHTATATTVVHHRGALRLGPCLHPPALLPTPLLV